MQNFSDEVWKDIKDFPDYQISNYGRVKSFKRNSEGLIMKEQYYKYGYAYVSLSTKINGATKKVKKKIHRLVLENFQPIEDMDNLQVNHKDENKTNNHIDNLEWVTAKENMNYGTRQDRAINKTSKKVLCIETGIIYKSLAEAARQTGIDQGNLSRCCNGIYSQLGGYHWQFV